MSESIDVIVQKRINPEISFNYRDLDTLQKSKASEIAGRLSDAGLTITFHAPFMDLRPGAIDPKIRKASTERLQQVFDLAPLFRPLTVVCHPSFDERYYVSNRQDWLANSIETWGRFLKLAEEMETVIALENVYETEPRPLTELFTAFPSPRLCFCFDTGHFNVFSHVPLAAWMEQLAPRLGQLHIHDNKGQADEHSPVGEGNFPFPEFFDLLGKRNLSPLVTLEAHSVDDLGQMIDNMKKMNLLAGS